MHSSDANSHVVVLDRMMCITMITGMLCYGWISKDLVVPGTLRMKKKYIRFTAKLVP